MEVLDTTIANVALRHIAGSLAAGQDESTHIVSSYVVANAIILPVSGWLFNVIGRKGFYMGCVVLFTMASVACAFATSVWMMLLFRMLQVFWQPFIFVPLSAVQFTSVPPDKNSDATANINLMRNLGHVHRHHAASMARAFPPPGSASARRAWSAPLVAAADRAQARPARSRTASAASKAASRPVARPSRRSTCSSAVSMHHGSLTCGAGCAAPWKAPMSQRTVLHAFTEVDDALIAYAAEQRRRNRLAKRVAQSRRAFNLKQYRQSVTDFLQVLTAQRTVLAAEQQLSDSTATVSANLVSLYRRLGGG